MIPETDPRTYFDAIQRELTFARVLGHPVQLVGWLLAVNVLFFVSAFVYGLAKFEGLQDQLIGFTPLQLFFYSGMKVSAHIDAGQWWRLWSSMFVHMDFAHILFNMWGLYALGPLLEKVYGMRRVLVLYVLTGLVGAYASHLFTDVPSGGASGAIYGLAGALGMFGWKFRKALPERVSKALTTGMMPWIVLGIGIGFLEAIPFDNAAHIGGFLSGAVLALFMRSHLDHPDRRRMDSSATLAAILVAGSLIYMLAGWATEITRCTGTEAAFLQCYPELLEEK